MRVLRTNCQTAVKLSASATDMARSVTIDQWSVGQSQ